MNDALKDFASVWSDARGRTKDLMEVLSESDLNLTLPRPGLDSIAKHLQEMLAVERCFVDAFATGVVDMANVPDVFAFPPNPSIDELGKCFASADSHLNSVLHGDRLHDSIECFGEQLSPNALAMLALAHEIFHQGQLTALMYVAGIRIPDSWTTNWALPKQD